jgi:hypothetical protein
MASERQPVMSQLQSVTSEVQPVIAYPSAKSPANAPEPARLPDGKVAFEIEIAENDIRARQFACHLVLRNNTANSIDVLAVNYRLGSGVLLEKSDNTSFLDLKREYDQLRADIKYLYRTLYITYVDGYSKEFARKYLEGIRAEFSFKNVIMVYFYVLTRGFKLYSNQMVQFLQRMDFPIASSADAQGVLKALKEKGVPVPLTDLLTAKIERMAAIEQMDKNFLRPEYITQILPGEDLERVYILKAKRKLSSIVSYTAAFDVKLAWDEPPTGSGTGRHVERTMSRSASFNVTPSPITLSIFAIIFSFLGAVMSSVVIDTPINFASLHSLVDLEIPQKYFVAAVLAVVLYNSIEMTEFRNKVPSFSWRSAMFIGLLCGLLSDRMLKAITSFVA